MPFIGILSDKKNEKEFKKILTKKTPNGQNKFDIININDKSIDNIKNIKFDTILIDKEDLSKYENKLGRILKGARYLIINSDLNINFDIIKDIETTVVTYGFNSKATITASSIEDDNNILCIQRNIKTANNSILEEQEIKLEDKGSSRYIDMGVTGVSLIYNMEKNDKY